MLPCGRDGYAVTLTTCPVGKSFILFRPDFANYAYQASLWPRPVPAFSKGRHAGQPTVTIKPGDHFRPGYLMQHARRIVARRGISR